MILYLCSPILQAFWMIWPLNSLTVSFVLLFQNARVALHGHLNGQPFSIIRTKSPKKTGLTFHLDNNDLTTQSVKDTMSVIEEKLGVSAPVVARTMFHGQHSLNDLLEATDAKLKDELSMIVPLQLWQEATTTTRAKSREASKKGAELQGMVALRNGDLERLKRRCDEAQQDLLAKEESLQAKELEIKSQLETATTQSDSDPTQSIDSLQTSLSQVTSNIEIAEINLTELRQKRDEVIQEMTMNMSCLLDAATNANQHHQQLRLECKSLEKDLAMLNNQILGLEKKWSVDLSNGLPDDFLVPDTCPTCLQPIVSNLHDSSGHSHNNLQQNAEEEIMTVLDSVTEVRSSFDKTTTELDTAKKLCTDKEEELTLAQNELQRVTNNWDDKVSEAAAELVQLQTDQKELSQQLAVAASDLQKTALAKSSSLESALKIEQDAVAYARKNLDTILHDVQVMEKSLKDIKHEMKDQVAIAEEMTSLSEAFGNRGIQTFVLQNAVDALQSTTQLYLDEFSDGAQRLQLTLDAGDRISRRALVREQDGDFVERPLATLSGGQWRRCSLALNLGFADLVARRGRLRPSLCVLDEPLTHLDRAGRTDVGRVLRKLVAKNDDTFRSTTGGDIDLSRFSLSTIIVILQDLAAEELEEAFDCMDEVVREGGSSIVKVDEDV